MRCDLHCPPGDSVIPLAVAVVVLAVLVSAAAALIGDVLEVAVVVVYASASAALWPLYRLLQYGSLRRPARVHVKSAEVNVKALPRVANRVTAHAARELPPVARAIGAPVFVVTPGMVFQPNPQRGDQW